MEFKIDICMDNAAFNDAPGKLEVVRMLHRVGEKLEAGYMDGIIRDLNGNPVGRFKIVTV